MAMSMIQTERDVIERLSWLTQFRAAEESRIAAAHDAAISAAEKAGEQASTAAVRGLETARSAAQRRYEQQVTALEGVAGKARREADAAMELGRSIIDERSQVDEAAARKRLDETAWMADTMLESALPRIREQYERAMGVVAEQRGLWSAVRQRAELSAGELIASPEWLRPAGAPVLPEGDALGAVTPLVTAAAERLPSLERAGHLRVLRDRGLFALTLAVLGAGLAGAAFGAARMMGLSAAAGGAAAAGTGVAVAAGLLLARSWAEGATRRRVEPMGLALAAADAAMNRAAEDARTRRSELEAAAVTRRDREIRDARRQAEETIAELREIHARHRDEAGRAHAERLAEVERERAEARRAAEEERERKLAEAESAYAAAAERAEREHRASRERAEADRARDWAALVERWHGGVRAAREAAATLGARWREATPAWASDDARLTAAERTPALVPIGRLTVDLAQMPGGLPAAGELAIDGPSTLDLPLALEFPGAGSLAVRFAGAAAGAGRAASIAALRTAMLRLITGFPPGKVRFTIVDPVGLGESFAAFMHLADYDPKLVGDRIWTEPRHIEQRLADLTEHMETVIQKYLRNQFATIDEYNRQAGEIAEPYRFLVIADFPANFTEAAARRLASIVASGPRCGVYVLMGFDGRQALPAGVPEEDVLRGSVGLSFRASRGTGASGEGRLVHDDPVFAEWPLVLDAPPDDARFNAIVHAVGAASKDAGRVRVPFATITPREGERWSRDSSHDLRIAMGRAGATRLQELTLGRGTSQHALIAGRTGSGKSTLLHAVITNAALWYGPDQLELYLIDFKKGVEFKTYAAHALPHARVIAVESEREFGLSVLRRLDGELKRRGELYRAAEVQDVAGFRAARPGVPMPRVMLIVDEFQELFVEDDRLAQEAALLLDRLVRQGRAFGVHVVLGSQTLGGAYSLARSTIGQMAVRIALQCSEQDSYLILSDDNAAARLLSRPGEAIYNDASGAVEGNSPFQVAWLGEDERDALLGAVRGLDEAARGGRSELLAAGREAPVVFEGSTPADMARNTRLIDAVRGRGGVAAAGAAPAAITLPLGEPVAIKEPTAAVLRRQAGSHLLIVGQRDEASVAMLAAAMLGLAGQGVLSGSGQPPALWLLDGTPGDAPLAGWLARLAVRLPGPARVVGYRDVEAALAELAAEVDRRTASESAGGGEGAPGGARSLVVMLHGLQRFRVLRRPDNEFDFSADAGARPDQALARVLRDGPAVGVHVIATCDTLAALNRVIDRQGLREFDQRVLMQMSAADSSALIDAPAAGQLGPARALLYSEEQGTAEKFRPYALPDEAWLERLLGPARVATAG